MNPWRYNRNGRPSDPIDQAALAELIKTGALPVDTLAWREGMPDWVKANTLPEFSAPAPLHDGSAPAAAVPPATPQTPPLPANPPQAALPPSTPVTGGTQPQAGGLASEAADIEQNKVFAVLAYISLLFLVPLLAAPKSRFARFHTNQGVVLFLASIAASVIMTLFAFLPFVSCLAAPLFFVVPIGSLVLAVIGIVNAASGQFKPLPLIGHFELLKTEPAL